MPELPEVEHLRRTLEPVLLGRHIDSVHLRRRDVLTTPSPRRPSHSALLGGAMPVELRRRGKQLAIIADDGRVLCVQLGMTGQLLYDRPGAPRRPGDHVHCTWRLVDGDGAPEGTLSFRDPRRFGGLTALENVAQLAQTKWGGLGPDALSISAAECRRALARTERAVKSALLDQGVLCGVGNIYADEALHRARIHPARASRSLGEQETRRLAAAIRGVLRSAVEAGGSTIRDYRDANGAPGWFAVRHAVYGRGGEPCRRCGAILFQGTLAQRTTVFCGECQT